MLLPWSGTRTVNTLESLLQHDGFVVSSNSPFYLEISNASDTVEYVRERLYQLANSLPDPLTIVEKLPEYNLRKDKYDQFVSDSLLREAYVRDRFDLAQAAISLQEMIDKESI
jgi:hypothetical protein